MTVAAHPSHPFAGRTLLQPEELNHQSFIAFDEEVIIQRELDRFFRDNQIEVSITMQLESAVQHTLQKSATLLLLQ